MQCGILSLEAREGGHSMVRIDMRYMWSAIDSPWFMPKRRHPSRGVVFKRSRRWKKGIGEVGSEGGGWGSVDRTEETDQGA